MKNFKVIVIKFKKNFLSILLFFFTIGLLIFPKGNTSAAQNGLKLWGNSIICTLFPFLIATEMLLYTNIPHFFGKFFKFIMKPLFNVSGEGSFALFMGWLSRISNWKQNSG